MFQFIAQTNDRYSVAETVQMAIEGGCKWIQLHLPLMDDSEIREISKDIIDMCREAAVFLTIEDRPELAKELGLHGVHFNHPMSRPAAAVREELGPEAVIGVGVTDAATILALRSADIDYVSLPASMEPEAIGEIVAKVREAGCELPIVATGNIEPDDAPVFIVAGASGIATGLPIIDAKNPVAETERMISNLNNAK